MRIYVFLKAYIEHALFDVDSRGNRTMQSVTAALKINCSHNKNLDERKVVDKVSVSTAKKKSPQN